MFETCILTLSDIKNEFTLNKMKKNIARMIADRFASQNEMKRNWYISALGSLPRSLELALIIQSWHKFRE